jgi:hypothetical protein
MFPTLFLCLQHRSVIRDALSKEEETRDFQRQVIRRRSLEQVATYAKFAWSASADQTARV